MNQSQKKSAPLTAEARFRAAFERLKTGCPVVVPAGTPATKGNVSREAGLTPEALKTARFPKLVAEIVAHKQIHKPTRASGKPTSAEKKALRRSDKQAKEDAFRQRDKAQSLLASASRRIIELTEELNMVRTQLEEHLPPPSEFGGRRPPSGKP